MKAKEVAVFGVSRDSVEEQLAFANKYRFPFELLSDEDGRVAVAFGVGFDQNNNAKRETFVLREGAIIWHDPTASTANHASDILAVIEEVEIKETVQ